MGSLGGFTANLQIVRYCLSGGLKDDRRSFVAAEMELDGEIEELYYKDFRGPLPSKLKNLASVSIKFIDGQVVPADEVACLIGEWEPASSYIGSLQLSSRTENRAFCQNTPALLATVDIILPLSMMQPLALMQGKSIRFDTVHDLIANPTEAQKADHLIAFVKRVHFQSHIK
ncbi:MAG: hypothetical protein DCC63_03285 [Nitrospira sp.]|nr:MAG: hypothetical protein DCC63_03285 [Nitrospira sp.]